MYVPHFKPHRCYLHSIISIHLLLLMISIPVHHAQVDYGNYYSECSKNATFECGQTNLSSISYPFWGANIRPSYCGLQAFNLSCQRNAVPAIDIGSDSKYRVVKINSFASAITLEHYDDLLVQDDVCAFKIKDTKLNTQLFNYSPGVEDLYMFYSCPLTLNTSHKFVYNYTCKSSSDNEQIIYGVRSLLLDDDLEWLNISCKSYIRVPVNWIKLEIFAMNLPLLLEEILKSSFEILYKINNTACHNCTQSGGVCWNGTKVGVHSACLSKPGNSDDSRLKIGIGSLTAAAAAAAAVICMLFLILLVCYRRMKTRNEYRKDVEAFIMKYGSSKPSRYRYGTLKKITYSFKEELGKGGYGNVYKGSLSDGRAVAVKVLNATKGNGEDFMNEVASIGRTSHVNVVTLLGYVYEGKKQALIYEFMPNGSLEKFIHKKEQYLSWEKLYSIALGIARGIEYLHCGCNTQILHFDIKPHNILLDKDFCPKISDFGLAKLYTREQSVLSSIMQARGTIGYIAPEVISRTFGQVSHKSDVYSYGMMILEMVGGRKNVDARAACTTEIYYPRWVYKHIHNNEETCSMENITEEENHIVRKMMIVGLWCIQTNPSHRPSISKVIEMLEGNSAALEIPPKPYMCSPPTSPPNFQQKTVSRSSSLSESNSLRKLVPRS